LPLEVTGYGVRSLLYAKLPERPWVVLCNVDLLEKNGFTPLHIASQNGHETVTMKLIVARGVEVEEESRISRSDLELRARPLSSSSELVLGVRGPTTIRWRGETYEVHHAIA
jgi:ankyrin repeat protein